MAGTTKRQLNIQRILLVALSILLCIGMGVGIFFAGVQSAVALEQELRCGIAEHSHTDECYEGDFLTCEKPAHSHNENCYIVLLADNNIDRVLELVSGDTSLEQVISSTVSSALVFNEDLNQEEQPAQQGMEQQTVVALNATIAEEESLPNLTLNEQINNLSTLETQEPSSKGEIILEEDAPQYLAVGSQADTSSNKANFYVYLDGGWQCIGTLPFTTQYTANSYSRYDGYVQTADMMNLVNQSLGTSYTVGDFSIVASTSQNNGYSGSNLTIGADTTRVVYNVLSYQRNNARYIRLVPYGLTSSTTSFGFNSVTLQYPEGYIDTKYVRTKSAFTFPAGNYEWKNQANNTTYQAGESVTISSKSTFVGVNTGPLTEVTVHYNVNFPTLQDATVTNKPTLAGTAVTSISNTFSEGASATTYNVSQHTVAGKVNNNSTGLSRVAQFKGWKIEGTDTIIAANTTLVWEELLQYQSSGKISLVGVWEHGPKVTATFFIRFDSVAVDSGGNVTGQDSNKYTNEIFSTYVGGLDTSQSVSTLHNQHFIDDDTPDNSYTADKEIRALYGGKGRNGAWLERFPTDQFVFEELVQYAKTGYLSVDGETVSVDRLNEHNYAIRWYVFKAQDDAWHIDGKLVKKTGVIQVEKTFNGNAELIEQIKDKFYIIAYNERTAQMSRLSLTNAVQVGNTYQWRLNDVLYDEQWTIIETPIPESLAGQDVYAYAEYNIIDPLGDQSRFGAGESATVLGRTIAVDEGEEMILRVQFNNIYHRSHSIIIKKQDYRTGAALGGAEFTLSQSGQALKFTYDEQNGIYQYDPDGGTHTILRGQGDGYFEISAEDFSYDNGAITIQEVTAPPGYSSVAAVDIGYLEDGKTIGILSEENEMIRYENGVLLVGNSTDTVSVVAQKRWECPEIEWQPVTVQLMANGKIASTLIGSINARAVLNAENGWTHQWEELPLYANGEKIAWSLVEMMIGDESAKTDGTFANWLVSYDQPLTTTADGKTTVTLKVSNTTKRVMLRLTKTDLSRAVHLQGAEFSLEAVDANGNPLANQVVKRGTTDASGVYIFDNMKVGVRYRLTELSAPSGYQSIAMPIYCTIREDGSVEVEEHLYAEAGSTSYNILIRNALDVPLPESGGSGTLWYIVCGLLMMATAGLYIYTSHKKGGVYKHD